MAFLHVIPKVCLTLLAGMLVGLAGCESETKTPLDAGGSLDADAAAPLLCNGRADLCERRLDQVALASTHNAMSAADWQFFLPNQPHDLVRQLDDGIRGMLLDIHLPGEFVTEVPADTALLCHANCVLGWRDLATELAHIKTWLDAHPREVLVWVLEDAAPIAAIDTALTKSGLQDYCLHGQKTGTPLPTLQAMISSGRRILVMLESGREDFPWAHGYAALGQDNPYSAQQVEDFSCERLRGSAGNPILNINHFLTTDDLTPRQEHGKVANAKDVLFDHVLKCQQQFGQLPNLVSVDWYTEGDLLELVDTLNDSVSP